MSKTPQPCGRCGKEYDAFHTCSKPKPTDEELLNRMLSIAEKMGCTGQLKPHLIWFKKEVQTRLLDKVENDVIGTDGQSFVHTPEDTQWIVLTKNQLRDEQRSALAQIREEEL